MTIDTSLSKSIYFKTLVILIVTTFTILGCQKEEDISTPLPNERFKVPSINDAKIYFNSNNKVPILDSNNGIELRTDDIEMTIKWDESEAKKYKDESQEIPQKINVLYTPIDLNTNGNIKLFLSSIEIDQVVESKYIAVIYTLPNNPNLLSGYVLIFNLEGTLEYKYKYLEGTRVDFETTNRINHRNEGDGDCCGFTMGEMLDWVGGDWFGLGGFIQDDEVIVTAYPNAPTFSDAEEGGYTNYYGNSDLYNPTLNIPPYNAGGSGGSGTNGESSEDGYIKVVWSPTAIFAHGLSISNAIEVDLSSIEANWLMNTATQEQLDAIAAYLNNADQTEDGGYNQGAIDYIMNMINLFNNNPNLSLTPDNTSNTDGYLEFQSFADYEDYLSNLNNPNQSYSNEDFNAGTNRRYSFAFEYNMPIFSHGIQTDIVAIVPDQNSCECLEISSVTTEIYGNTTLVAWEQIGDYWTELSQIDDTLTVFVRGKKIRGIQIDGWRWQETIIFTYYMTLNYSTGYVSDYGTYSIL